MQTPLELYRRRIADGAIRADAEQERAATALNRLYNDVTARKPFFARRKPLKGVYMYGGVGRGKSMLMDLFFSVLPDKTRKRRVHFHAFMIETHDWLHTRRVSGKTGNLFEDYADHVADAAHVLCFDEFHVTDVADAMILSRLFAALFEKNVAVVATSNWPPDLLYKDGLQREYFLPFIALLKDRAEIVHLDSPVDYRAIVLHDLDTYLWPLNAVSAEKAEACFLRLSDGRAPEKMVLRVKGRDIAVREANGAARFTFAQLCEQPHGAEDYLKIAEEFHTVFIENIPKLGYDRRNETKRLMTLIDVLYDTRRRVVITAEAPPEKIYVGDDYKFEFDRTISRLREMQSSSYAVA